MGIKNDTIKYVGTFKAQSDGAKEGVLVKMTCYKAKYEGILGIYISPPYEFSSAKKTSSTPS